MPDLLIRGSLNIHPGKQKEFAEVAAKMMTVTRTDTHTLSFDTFIDEENGVWVALERYPDSEGLMRHFANQDQVLREQLMALCTPGFAEIFGDPSPELAARLSSYKARIYKPLHSI